MPPTVLPAVATSMAGQNRSALPSTTNSTAGSDPSGSSVAETKAMQKRLIRPYCGTARKACSDSNQDPIVRDYPGRRRSSAGAGSRAILCLFFRHAPSFPAAMHIGHIPLANRLFAAPMAGVTDRPFRQLCKKLGAGYAVSEMVTSRRDLWNSLKTSRRANHEGEVAPIAVQIAGTDPQMMAEAAAYNIDRGAQIIDINMGCPAK